MKQLEDTKIKPAPKGGLENLMRMMTLLHRGYMGCSAKLDFCQIVMREFRKRQNN